MMVSPEIQARLDKVWHRLQRLLQIEPISQIDLDRECMLWLETAVTLEEELFSDVFEGPILIERTTDGQVENQTEGKSGTDSAGQIHPDTTGDG